MISWGYLRPPLLRFFLLPLSVFMYLSSPYLVTLCLQAIYTLYFSITPSAYALPLFSWFFYYSMLYIHIWKMEPETKVTENMLCLSFCLWVMSHNMIFSTSILLPAKFTISISFTAESYYVVSMYEIYIIYSPGEGFLCCFYSPATVKRWPRQVSGGVKSFGHVPRIGQAGSYNGYF